MLELTLRPAHNDHRVLGDLIASGVAGWSGRSRPIFNRIVLDATVATAQTQLAQDAASAGIPVLVDPMTFLLQYDTSGHAWSELSFGDPGAVGAASFHDAESRDQLIRRVVDFQIDQGATAVIPPYFYSAGPKDPLFAYGLTSIRETRKYLDSAGLNFALFPVLCGRVDNLSHPDSWSQGLDWFSEVSKDNGSQDVAVQLSPVGDFSDNYSKLFYYFRSIQRIQHLGLNAHAWRQGALGRALAAAGAAGYETGLQYGNKTDLSSLAASKKPRDKNSSSDSAGGGGGGQVYLTSIGRWISSKQVVELSKHGPTKDALLCDDPVHCCSGGIAETLAHRRQHAVRSHSRGLAGIAAMPPNVTWRMHQIAKEAGVANDSLARMNKVLSRASLPLIKTTSHLALLRIAEDLSRLASSAA